jgi:hypothetical protein
MSETREVNLVDPGGGTANKVASKAAADGLETILIEKGPETIHVHPAMNRVLESAFRDAAAKPR